MKIVFPGDQKIEHPDRLILTIYTSPDHFSFSLYDPEKSGSYYYKELSAKNRSAVFDAIKDAFFDQAFFSLPFRNVLIMNRTPYFVFVPDSIFKEEYKEDFLQFLLSDHTGITMTGSVSSAGIKVLYQLPDDIYRLMLRSFSKPVFVHYSTPMITYFLNKSKNDNNRQMVVNLQKSGLDIFCFSKDSFLLGNFFRCNDLPDALYYILYTWKQLQMNQSDDSLHITGEAVYREELIEKLELYLQNIRFPVIAPENHFKGIETGRIPFELAALSVCEL